MKLTFEKFKHTIERNLVPRWKYILPYTLIMFDPNTFEPKRYTWGWHTLVYGLHIRCPDENGLYNKNHGHWCWPWQWYRKYYATYLMRNR